MLFLIRKTVSLPVHACVEERSKGKKTRVSRVTVGDRYARGGSPSRGDEGFAHSQFKEGGHSHVHVSAAKTPSDKRPNTEGNRSYLYPPRSLYFRLILDCRPRKVLPCFVLRTKNVQKYMARRSWNFDRANFGRNEEKGADHIDYYQAI